MCCMYKIIYKVTCLVDKGKGVDVVYLVFSRAFGIVSCSTVPEKLDAWGLDGHMLCWMKKLAGWPSLKNCGEWSYIHLVAGQK